MFKKALQVATAFGVLLAGYAGYVHVFAFVARAVSLSSPGSQMRLVPTASKTNLRAHALAEQHLGSDHWAADNPPICLYNADRGFYMYARDYTRHPDGKHVDFYPFAIIAVSGDGRAMKSATSDIARVELDKPFDLAPKPGASGGLRVVHARIEGDVNLRDDKGTPQNPADDLRIGPLTWIEYDEAKLQINSDSDVVIEDDVYRITGTGLLIKLRPKDDGVEHPPGTPTGFEDAQTAYLFKNVHIILSDVGAGGILPGTTQPTSGRKGEPNPLDLRCDGLMQIDFPKRPAPLTENFVGPSAPKGPTVAQFSRNVEVLRGKPGPNRDQLNCDHLRLTLVPPEKPPAPAAPDPTEAHPLGLDFQQVAEAHHGTPSPAPDPSAPSPAAKGPMTDLTLKEAVADGHNVRLVSAAQDVKVRCNELIYTKQHPGEPDTTYFRGDRTTRLIVEKTDRFADGPEKGKVQSYTLIRAIDAKIFDDHRGNDYAIIVASGPGEMETRPNAGPDGAVERTAHWNDLLTIRPIVPAARPGAAPPPAAATDTASPPVRKRITLTGKPGFTDIPAKATLDGRDRKSTIDIWLRPKAKPPVTAAAATATAATTTTTEPGSGTGTGTGAGAYEIEHLVASKDVLLTTPGKRLTARNDLQAAFVPADAPATILAPGANPGTKNPAAAARADATVPPGTTTNADAAPPAKDKAKESAPARPDEPEAKANADRVWARVFLRNQPKSEAQTRTASGASPGLLGGDTRTEIDEVRLRGAVTIEQAPAPGKQAGTNIVGEAVDLFNQGGRGSKFIVYSADPKPVRNLPNAGARANAPVGPDDELFTALAMVDTGEMVIRGRQIGLDQATDNAWVDGNGSLTQLAARGLLSDKGLGSQKPAADADKAKPGSAVDPKSKKTTPMTIFFAGLPDNGKGMRFFGRSTDPKGRSVARAEFYRDVHAETDEATLDCQDVLRTYFDRTVKLARRKSPQGESEPGSANTDAEIALIECVKKVVVVNTKRDPETQAVVQRNRIVGEYLTYEKLTGKFYVPGPGIVYLYELEGKSNALRPGGEAGNRQVIRPAAGPARDQPRPVRRGGVVVGRNDTREPAVGAGAGEGRAPAKTSRKPGVKRLPPLVLTQIGFATEMNGRFGSGKDSDKTEDRRADFFGDVEALRARVADAGAVLDPERPPPDGLSLTAQTLRVVSEPPRPEAVEKDPNAPPRYLLRAWEDASAESADKAIQADVITYDSLTNLLYYYGEDGRDVVIAQQDQVGQTPTVTSGRTLMYNIKTNQSQLADPRTLAFIQSKTGYRPSPVKPPDDKLKPRLPKRKAFQNNRGNIERKDFTGH